MRRLIVLVVLVGGCRKEGPDVRVAPGARRSIPDCENARSSTPSVVSAGGSSFEALAPGDATIRCDKKTVRMTVGEIHHLDIDGPTTPQTRHTFLELRAWDAAGHELMLFEAVGVQWTLPEGAGRHDFCGHGASFCDNERVQGVDAEVPGTYHIEASYRGHRAGFDLTFVPRS